MLFTLASLYQVADYGARFTLPAGEHLFILMTAANRDHIDAGYGDFAIQRLPQRPKLAR